jgi:hypothetical protein
MAKIKWHTSKKTGDSFLVVNQVDSEEVTKLIKGSIRRGRKWGKNDETIIEIAKYQAKKKEVKNKI